MANPVEMKDMSGMPRNEVREVRYPYLKSKYDRIKKEIILEKTWLVFTNAEDRFLTQKEVIECQKLRTELEQYHFKVYTRPNDILVQESAQIRMIVQEFRKAHSTISIVGQDF